MVFKIRTFSLPRTKEELLVIDGCPLKRFSLKEIKLATNQFSNHNILGRGGFGKVYRGQLPDGSFIAVKRCKDDRTSGSELQFHAEVEIGSSQASDHPNILRLLGYCMTRSERILVYPFMVNRDVRSRLHGRPVSDPPLDWPTRKRIALGSAKGIAHLHYGSSFTFIHRDIKAANILLNDQFEAALCDFGLSKFVSRNGNESNFIRVRRPMEEEDENEDPSEEDDQESDDDQETCCFTKSCWNFTRAEYGGRTKWSCWAFTKNEVLSESGHSTLENIGAAQPSYDEFNTHVTTAVRGTIGHIAPEYLSTGKCTIKNDVFGYGILLLELITGQKAFDLARLANEDHAMLLDWVKDCVGDDKLDLLVDSDLTGDYVKEEMKQLIILALSCTKEDPDKRPIMSEITRIIENLGKYPLLRVENDLSVQRFSLDQLKVATYNFSNKNMIGKSGFGKVYRGRLKEDGSTVVVKRLLKRSKRGKMQFLSELKLGGIIARGNPNVLQLRGYCIAGKERLLVYPFMANRSLEWRLRAERSLALDWHVRKKIALGVAKGIAYLLYDCESYISIERDVKPYNILLDDEFNPVLCNLRLQSNDSSQESGDQDSISNHSNTDHSLGKENQVSYADDVYGYGIILFVLISGKVSTDPINRDSFYNDSTLHYWFKKLRRHQLELLVDPRLNVGGNNYNTMHIKDEIEQLIQVSLLCTQPSSADRPEMWEVMQMIQGISEGDLKVCFQFDRANLLWFDETLQPQLVVELGDTTDSPKLDSEGSASSEFDQTNENQLSINIASKGKQVASISIIEAYISIAQHTKLKSQGKGITISDNASRTKMQEIWRTFLSEIVLPPNSKLCRSGTNLCPMCNEYEEDNFHLFFRCDFSRQAWQLAMGVRIDMLGFGSVKEGVDVILKPNAAGLNILPKEVEASRFTHKSVALMHSIWTHRNQVCSDNVYPNVIQMLKDHPDATDPYEATLDADGCAMSTSDLASFVQCGSSIEIEPIQLQPDEVLPKVLPRASVQEIEPTRLQPECESSHEIEQAQLQSEEVLFPENHTNCVKYESSQEIEQAKLQSEEVITEVLTNYVPWASSQEIEPTRQHSECESSHEIKRAELQLEILFPEIYTKCAQFKSSPEINQAQLQPEEGITKVLDNYVPCGSCQVIEAARLPPEQLLITQQLTNCVQCESSHEIEEDQLQSDDVLFFEVLANSVNYKSSEKIGQAQALQPKLFPEVLESCVQCESSQEIVQPQLQPEKSSQEIEQAEKVFIPKASEHRINNNNNQQEDFQLNITTSGIFLSFKFTKLSVMCVILLASLCMNIVSLWPYAKPRY